MALDSYELTKQRSSRPRWTPEEDAVLLQTWQDWSGPTGQARAGFIAHLCKLFPHRQANGIKHRKTILVRTGKAPRKWDRNKYIPFQLTESACHYLAALLDGEGSLNLACSVDRRRGYNYAIKVPTVVLCYNADEGILEYVQGLLPCKRHRVGKPGTDTRGIITNHSVYCLAITGFFQMRDILMRLLPYMKHSKKVPKAQAILEYINGRLEALNVRHF